jgi:ribonuclease D
MQTQKPIDMITATEPLRAFCARLASENFVTVDTEFLRETTYYPKLCLVQIAGEHDAALIDPLAEGIDLAPFLELMANEKILKVFHAARQDVEIILKMAGTVPKPIFDTQIAAMVLVTKSATKPSPENSPMRKSTSLRNSRIGRAAR